MKTYSNLYPKIFEFDRLDRAYRRARRGKRDRVEVMRFERDLECELIQIQNELVWGEYATSPYRTFYVHEPKTRLVAALPFRDRVVQHSLFEVLEPIWEQRFIHHSYACRPGKGLHHGADQAQRWLREVKRKHGKVYALKADIAKYFPSIDHDILKGMIERRVTCSRTLDLCEDIIDSWHPGLPIGNLSSQLWANVYLHELDSHVKQELGVQRYMRYMDDWIVIHHDKAYLHRLREHLERWLWRHLRLKLNHKTQVFPVSARRGRSLDYLGYRIWLTHRRLREDSVKRMRKRLREMEWQFYRGEIDHADVQARIQSWLGHASHADTYRIRSKLLGNSVFTRPHPDAKEAA